MSRHYTIEQIETYEVEANSVEEAMEIVSNWEYDGEYNKVSEAITLIKEAEASE